MSSMRSRLLAAVTLAVVVFATGGRPIDACGPFFRRAVFTYAAHPDFPLDRFAAGRIGIPAPTWARSQLVVAYRYLSGVPLEPAERADAVALWTERFEQEGTSADEAAKPWLDARSQIAGSAVIDHLGVMRPDPKTYDSYLNCPGDAFRVAAATLADRAGRYGATSGDVKIWLAGQDAVFANCSGPLSTPAALPTSAPAWLKADREYQMASALFYAGDYERARGAFQAIGQDAASPWHVWAPYLAARAVIRKATVREDAAALEEAEGLLTAVVADPRRPEIHAAAARLLAFVVARLRPDSRAAQLGAGLRVRRPGPGFRQDLADYTLVLDKILGDDVPEERRATIAAKLAETETLRADDDMTDWILTFQANSAAASRHALERYRQTSAAPWLVAALAKASPSDAATLGLLDNAGRVDAAATAYPAVVYHALRLRIARGEAANARTQLDGLLARTASWPRSDINAVLTLRLTLATSLNEFLRFGQRTPAGISWDMDAFEKPVREFAEDASTRRAKAASEVRFDEDATQVLNAALPVRVLADTTHDPAVSAALRTRLALATWTRSALLGDTLAATSVASLAGGADPQLKPLVDAYLAAPDNESREFAAVFAALRFPGLRPVVDGNLGRETALGAIDEYRDNWWCAVEKVPAGAGAAPVAFLSPADKAAAQAEHARLEALGPAPNYLGQRAVAFASAHPGDPRVPEALHLAVRATRFGCTDGQTTRWSKQAFTLLHRQYPTSEWAKKTPYYY